MVGIVILLVVVSCLKDTPETFPYTFEWDPEVAFPLGDATFGMDAVSGFDTLLLELDSITGYPEWVYLTEIPIRGYISFDITTITENISNINRLLFRVNAFNRFPEEVILQAYFSDGINYLDSLFVEEPLIVASGTVEGNGETINPTHARKDALFTKERIDKLKGASDIIFQAIIRNATLDTTLIPYYPTYILETQIGAMADLNLR